MIKNFFRIAIRNLVKNKGYSVLNILGLAVGLTCFAFISIWVKDELSYDKFNKKADRIFRVTAEIITQAESFKQAVTSIPMAAAFKNDFPEVENAVRLDRSDAIVQYGDKQFSEDGIVATDPSFFDVFSYSLKQGDPETALNNAYSIVLTESMAKKYFGNENPVGKSLHVFLYDTSGKGQDYAITGIIPDAPKNAHFTFNFLVSMKSLETANPQLTTAAGWGNNSFYTYLLLRDKKSRQKVEAGLPDFMNRQRPGREQSSTNQFLLSLQPLTDIHLKSDLRYEIEATSSIKYVYIFITIGLFILLIAAINYMNMATASSLSRSKEVGVKKVMGASKKQLVGQYIAESVLVSLLSLLAAVLLAALLKPVFTQLSGKELSLFDSPGVLVFLVLVTLVIGFLSGLYPAFFITAYKAADVLKGSLKAKPGGAFLRKGLVILQFSIAVVLIVGIIIVNSQMNYISNKDLGFEKEALLSLKVNGNADVIQNFPAFKNSLLSDPLIKGVTTSNTMIIGGIGNSSARTVDGKGQPLHTGTYRLRVDANYLDVYGMTLLKGRNFYTDHAGDTLAYIVNESAVRAFGWKNNDDAVGKPFEMNRQQGTVVGVVKDFHFHTLQHPIDPLVMVVLRNNFSQITVKADLSDVNKTMATISAAWKKHFPGALMEQSFVEDRLQDQYQAQQRYSRFFLYFSVLSLLIACLGLLGLTAYATKQRVKEIGIRKVLGASVGHITTMLSVDFLKLVILGSIIAFPVAWLVMNKWLHEFSYRISINWWVFILAGFITVLIALLTVSVQAIKAAIMNPVKSLRTE